MTSGRPDAQVEGINATVTLTEIATQKVVLQTSTFSRASFDIPGSAQRFAQQRAARNAEDRAVGVIAQNIRNRLASYFRRWNVEPPNGLSTPEPERPAPSSANFGLCGEQAIRDPATVPLGDAPYHPQKQRRFLTNSCLYSIAFAMPKPLFKATN